MISNNVVVIILFPYKHLRKQNHILPMMKLPAMLSTTNTRGLLPTIRFHCTQSDQCFETVCHKCNELCSRFYQQKRHQGDGGLCNTLQQNSVKSKIYKRFYSKRYLRLPSKPRLFNSSLKEHTILPQTTYCTTPVPR